VLDSVLKEGGGFGVLSEGIKDVPYKRLVVIRSNGEHEDAGSRVFRIGERADLKEARRGSGFVVKVYKWVSSHIAWVNN
tara:strand:- start:1065 stop:1301 length:237 start_codon:yes stop_codon:yes gene_type:complete